MLSAIISIDELIIHKPVHRTSFYDNVCKKKNICKYLFTKVVKNNVFDRKYNYQKKMLPTKFL